MTEEVYEEENKPLPKKDHEMDLEKLHVAEEVHSTYRSVEPQKEAPMHIEPALSQILQKNDIRPSQRHQINHKRQSNHNGFTNSQNMNFSQSQDPNYMLKLAKAFDDSKVPKGKLKFSQKFNFPSSSSFLDPRKVCLF